MASHNPMYHSFNVNEMRSAVGSKSKTTTKLIIQNAVRVFKDYIVQKTDLPANTIDDCYTVSIAELDEVLKRFYADVRQRNGEIYMKKSMISLRYGLQRHFVSTRNVDVINDARFRPSNQMFGTVLARLKQDGKDIVRHKQPITVEDRQKMYAQNVLGLDNPTSLQRKVFFDMIFHLCKKGREDLHMMKKSAFQVSLDNNGSRYVHHSTSYLMKNLHDERDTSRMYELVGDRLCPVKSFMKYISKLSPRNPNIWQRPKPGKVGENYPVWYLNVNMGHNALGSMMRNISTAANLSQVYTNQCIRATSNLELDRKWYEFREMMTEDHVDDGLKRRVSWELTSSAVPKKRINTQQPYCDGNRRENNLISSMEASLPMATTSVMPRRSPMGTRSPMATSPMTAKLSNNMAMTSPMVTRSPMATTSPMKAILSNNMPMTSSMVTRSPMATTSNMVISQGMAIRSPIATTSEMATRSNMTISESMAMRSSMTTSEMTTRSPMATTSNMAISQGMAIRSSMATTSEMATRSPMATTSPMSISQSMAIRSSMATTSEMATRSPMATTSPMPISQGMAIRSSMATTSEMTTRSPMATSSLMPMKSELAARSSIVTTSPMAISSNMAIKIPSVANPTSFPIMVASPDVHIKEEMVAEMLNPFEYLGEEQLSNIRNEELHEYDEHVVMAENNLIEHTRVMQECLLGEESPKVVSIAKVDSIAVDGHRGQLYIDESLVDNTENAVGSNQRHHIESTDIVEDDLCPLKNSSLLLIDDEDNTEGREEMGIKIPFKRLTERHFIAVNKGRTPLGNPSKPQCIVCSDPAVRLHRTEFICEQCILPMCPIPCFKRYHTVTDYKAECSFEYHNK